MAVLFHAIWRVSGAATARWGFMFPHDRCADSKDTDPLHFCWDYLSLVRVGVGGFGKDMVDIGPPWAGSNKLEGFSSEGRWEVGEFFSCGGSRIAVGKRNGD